VAREFGVEGDGQSQAERAEQTAEAKSTPNATLPLPLTDRAGRPFRPIGIYQSQLVDLVPSTFRAVSIGQLQQAVGTDAERLGENETARLVSGFYDIRLDDQLLVSERSELVIEHPAERLVRQRLGRVNLAILHSFGGTRSTTPSGTPNSPHLEVNHEGELIAVIPEAAKFVVPTAGASVDSPAESPPDRPAETESQDDPSSPEWVRSKLRFGWTLQSQSMGNAKKFELRLPRTSLTRLVISTPSNIVLESRQGVLVERPGPPPDADVQSRTGDIRWYVLEAGGLNRIEIYAKRRSIGDSNRPFLIRRESKQYEVDLSGVTWKHRMTIELPERRERVRLRLPLGTVTAIRVNSVETRHQVLQRADGQSLIDIQLPGGFYGENDFGSGGAISAVDRPSPALKLVTLTIEGTSDWELGDGICNLPSAILVDSDVYWTESSTQVVIAVLDPLEVAEWTLPPLWQQDIQTPARVGETLMIAEGPPFDAFQDHQAWSRLRLVQRDERSIEGVWTRLHVQQTPSRILRSTTRIRCGLLQKDQPPIHVDVNPEWTIDSVSVLGSGRQISTTPGSRELVIWPTSGEASQSMLEIDFIAHQNLPPGNRKRLEIPSTWVIRPRQRAASQLMSVQPPKLRRWDANSVMLPGRVDPSELDDDELAFFQPTPETLVLQSPTGWSPAVALENIDVSLGVSLRHSIATEGNDVSETIVVRADTSQPITELSLLTGQSQKVKFDWSLRRMDQSATVSLPSTSVTHLRDDPLGTYAIELDGRDLREYELVGQRFYTAQDQLTLSLPSIRGATSQSAEVELDHHWELSQVPQGVQLVPGNTLGLSKSLPGEQSQHLRYDPSMRPEIVLNRSQPNTMTCVVWNQLYEVTANSRSEDHVQLVADVSTRKPIRLDFDDDLEIVSVSRNGSAYIPERIGLGTISIAPQKQSDRISILLMRRHSTTDWIRRCDVPRVSIDGYVIQNRAVYRTGPETLVLHQVMSDRTPVGRSEADPASFNDSGDVSQLILIPRNVAIGLGWLGAAILFCFAWSLARWFPKGIHCLFVLVVLSVSGSVIWWPWQIAILGWIAVPIALGGLLQVVIDASKVDPAMRGGSTGSVRLEDTQSKPGGDDPAVDFSVSIPISSLLISATLFVGASVTATAQNSPMDESRREPASGSPFRSMDRSPIELLVPLDQDHQPVGDKVYLSQADYDSIASVVDPDRPVDAQFQSAEYRVVLTPPRDEGQLINAEIQADYRIHLPRETTRVRLPVRSETLRRIEWLSDEESQIIRFNVDQRGVVTVSIPSSRDIRLRLTFVPTVSAVGDVETESTNGRINGGDSQGADLQGADLRENASADDVPESLSPTDLAAEVRTSLVRLAIPAVHSSNMVVEAPREIIVQSLGEPLGRTTFRSELGRYEADLGPIRELTISCKLAGRPALLRSQSLRRSYRIAAGIDSTVVECEVDPGEPVAEGDTLQLTILGGPPTSLTSGGWLMLNNETADQKDRTTTAGSNAAGGVYRFIKQTGNDSPLRLLWRLPSVLNASTSKNDSKVMPIPEVFSSAAMRSSPTMFAIDAAPSIRVSELASGSLQASEEEFLSAWRGYPGKIDRVFVVRDDFPSFVLMQDKYPAPAITLDHGLHIAADKIELELKATIVDPRPSVRRVLMAMPHDFELVRCLINGQPPRSIRQIPSSSPASEIQTEFSLGDQRIDGKILIEMVGQRRFSGTGTFDLPRFSVLSEGDFRETYRITRSRSLVIQVKDSGTPIGQDDDSEQSDQTQWQVPGLTQSDLLAGRLPVAFAESPREGRVVVKRRPGGDVFACNQKTLMRYSDGQWSCDTLLELQRNRVPDYVDLEIPTRWAADLSVSGRAIWVKRQSTDSVVTVIRVATESSSAGKPGQEDSVRRVMVTARFDNRDQSRVSVPKVKVLGEGKRNQVVAVPNRLTTEIIQWERVEVSRLKDDNKWFIPFGDEIESPNLYSRYVVDGNNWSVELEPLSQAAVDPVALSCDAKVFLDGTHALVLQRFDLLPETRDEIAIALPEGARCIGIWSAGREVNLDHARTKASRVNRQQSSTPKAVKIEVPLSYSRLPQSLEILVEIPVMDRRITDYLSQLLGIPTREVWIAFYQSPLSNERRRLDVSIPIESTPQPAMNLAAEEIRRENDRALSLAESVVIAIDRSRDMLAERSDEEIESWLYPWITRYQSIAISVGHRFQMSTPDGNEENNPIQTDSVAGNGAETEVDRRWSSLDARLLQLAGRFLQSNPELPRPLFESSRFRDHELISVLRVNSFTEPPPLTQTFTPHKSLQSLLVNAITLVTFGLAIVLMWPFRGRFRSWIRQPSVWLFVIGFLGLFLIPPPAAVALMIIAVTLPIINRSKARSTPSRA
jgi:hypothetical protein